MRASLRGRPLTLQPGRLVPLLAVSLEVLWGYRVLAWVSGWEALGWPGTPLSLGSALGLALAAEVLTRFALGRSWDLSRVRPLLLSTLLALLALALHLDQGAGYYLWDAFWSGRPLAHLSALVAGLAFGLYLLWRGIAAGRERLPFGDLYPKFAVGLTALVLLQVLWATGPGAAASSQQTPTAVLYLVAYFAIGLLALALVNLEAIQGQMRRHEEASGAFYRRWLVMVAALTLGILAFSLGLAGLFSFDLVPLLLQPLAVLADWLVTAFVYVVVYPLALLFTGLLYLLRLVIHWLRGGQVPPPLQAPDFSDLPRAVERQASEGLPPEVLLALKWGFLVLVVSLVLFLLARALFRYWKETPEEEVEEVSESLWSLQVFQNDLRSLLEGWLRWFRRWKPSASREVSPPLAVRDGEALDRLFDVRELYRGLLWEGRQQGMPRRPAETPYEYRGRLGQRVLPSEGPELAALQAITEAYVSERYGDRPLTGDPLTELNGHWRRLRSFWRGPVEAAKPGKMTVG